MQQRLVRIPRHLLHVELDDLPEADRAALLPLLADLPGVPDASFSAQLIGPGHATVAALAVLARHIGQGLRDENLRIAHDRDRLRVERHKLVFLDAEALLHAVTEGDQRPVGEAVLCVVDALPERCALEKLLATREAAGLASFVTTAVPLPRLAHWRSVHL